jgi:hypothetical protein
MNDDELLQIALQQVRSTYTRCLAGAPVLGTRRSSGACCGGTCRHTLVVAPTGSEKSENVNASHNATLTAREYIIIGSVDEIRIISDAIIIVVDECLFCL